MKVVLEFNLPEDQTDFRLAQDGWKWKQIVSDVLQHLKECYKYGKSDQYKTVGDALDSVRNVIVEGIEDNSLSLDD